jgi:hypothetical protein
MKDCYHKTRRVPSCIFWACAVDLSKRDWKSAPSMFPCHVDGGFHIVCQDNKLRWSAVIVCAEANDVDLSHSGRKIARKTGESKRDLGFALGIEKFAKSSGWMEHCAQARALERPHKHDRIGRNIRSQTTDRHLSRLNRFLRPRYAACLP